jgi:hypothetical protein
MFMGLVGALHSLRSLRRRLSWALNIIRTNALCEVKKYTLSATDLIAYVSVAVSILALTVSVRSCQVSQNALNVAVLEYNNARALVLKGSIQDGSTHIQISPLDSAFFLQEIHYRFPSEFGTGRKYAAAPNHVLALNDEINYFKNLLVSRYRDEVQAGVIIGENARMPFLIEAYASTRGQSFRSTSIYTLNFEFKVYGDSLRAPSITLTGITFGSRIDHKQDAQIFLENEWKEAKKQ